MKKSIIVFLTIILAFSMALAACSSKEIPTTQEPAKEEPANEPAKEEPANEPDGNSEEAPASVVYKQAPMLDDKGLPPVAERLGEEPKLAYEMPPESIDLEIGTYGGTLRTVSSVIEWDADLFIMNNEPLLYTPGLTGDEVTGNVLKGYEMSADEKTFTFFMRKGMRWSDGEPVTVEDVRFTVEDILFNEELTPAFPAWLKSGGKPEGEPFTFEIVDDFTFKMSFEQSYGGLLLNLAVQGWKGYSELLRPAHYLKQFHVTYTPLEELEPAIDEAGFEPGEWVNLFNDKDITNWELTHSKAIGFPVLYPWIYVKKSETTGDYERNPYYFKVDAEGNQLPYIDYVQSSLVQDIEMVTMKTIAGEVDFSRESAALVKMPLYKENEKNGYKALLADMHVTPTDIYLNLTHEDPVWREVVRDVRFRKALNMAINRDEIIDAIYYGFADPSATIDPTFNVDEANKLLDEMGMTVGSDGFRQGPDGKKFTIPFEIGAQAPDIVPLTELVVEMWKELKLDVTMKTLDGALWGTRNTANELKALVIWSSFPMWFYGEFGQSKFAPLWNRWFTTGGKEGEEPPAEAKAFLDSLADAATKSPVDAKASIDDLLDNLSENLWYFVHVENVKQPLIVNENLGNVPHSGFAIAADYAGEQFFYRQ